MTEWGLADDLQIIKLGSGIAENDDLLMECTVKTPHFLGLYDDRIDLILGSKGAGKSSLFRIFGEYQVNNLLNKKKTVVVTGVETSGEPVFKQYENEFNEFSESQFVTFWKIYILSLIYNRLINDPGITSLLNSSAPAAVDAFKKECEALHIIDVGKITSATQLLKTACAFAVATIQGVRVGWDYSTNRFVFDYKPTGALPGKLKEITVPDTKKLDTILCIDSLFNVAKSSGYKIWILLDHLDVVFKRRSSEESRALRALLKVAQVFSSPELRLKIFLRDDILDAITVDAPEPFAGLSHAAGRPASNLTWSGESLCVMIVKRLASNQWLANRYALDTGRLDDVTYARQCFHSLFNFKYKRQLSFDWILSLISDGRDIATPRDLIDLLTLAFQIHSGYLQKHPQEKNFMSIRSIQAAHSELSKNRLITVLKAEFLHLMPWINKLEHGKEKYTRDEAASLFGSNHEETVEKLLAVGVLRHNVKKAIYSVAKLYAPGLNVYATVTRRRKMSA